MNSQNKALLRKEFIDKCKGGDERMVERYIEDYGFDINTRDSAGKTLLHYAVLDKNRDFARFLLNYAIDPAICDRKGKKALDYADAQEGKKVSVYAKTDMDDIRRILTEKPDLYPEVAEIVWLLRNGSNEEELIQAVKLLSENRDLRRALDRRELLRLKKSMHPDVQALMELIGKDRFSPDRLNSCTECGRYTLKYIRQLTRGAAAPTPAMEIEYLNECLSCGARVVTWN